MRLDERDDTLNKELQSNTISQSINTLVRDAARRKLQVYILGMLTVVEVALIVGFGILLNKVQETANLSQSNQDAVVANCEVTNESRAGNRVLWRYLLTIAESNELTTVQKGRVAGLKKIVSEVFVERDCQSEIGNIQEK